MSRPRKAVRADTANRIYFDHPLDTDRPIPIQFMCPRCKRTMFHLEIAKDAFVVVLQKQCGNCCAYWKIKVRRSGTDIVYQKDEKVVDSW